MHPAEGTLVEVKGRLDVTVDPATLVIPPPPDMLSADEVRAFVKEHGLKVVGATVGEDEHSVGMREIIDIKHGGLEGFGVACEYLGTSVPVEKVLDAAIEHAADAVLISTIITHGDMHRQNMEKLADLAVEKGVRDRLLLIAGGTQVTGELARDWGMDAGFGRGTKGIDVASFMVKALRERQRRGPEQARDAPIRQRAGGAAGAARPIDALVAEIGSTTTVARPSTRWAAATPRRGRCCSAREWRRPRWRMATSPSASARRERPLKARDRAARAAPHPGHELRRRRSAHDRARPHPADDGHGRPRSRTGRRRGCHLPDGRAAARPRSRQHRGRRARASSCWPAVSRAATTRRCSPTPAGSASFRCGRSSSTAATRSSATTPRELLERAGFRVRVTSNVYPAVDELDIVPARAVIHDAFEEHIIHAPGMERIGEVVKRAHPADAGRRARGRRAPGRRPRRPRRRRRRRGDHRRPLHHRRQPRVPAHPDRAPGSQPAHGRRRSGHLRERRLTWPP